MVRVLFFLILLIPELLSAQHVVVLSVTQPPEIGFSLSGKDTTILKGKSVLLGADLVVYGGSGNYSYKWSPSETLNDPFLLHPVAFPADTTIYILTVTDGNGCSFSLDYTVNVDHQVVKTSLTTAAQDLHAVLFPNPNDGTFKIKLSGTPSRKIELTIFDNTGRVVKLHTLRNFNGEHTESLHLNLVSGAYLLRVESDTSALSRQFIIN